MKSERDEDWEKKQKDMKRLVQDRSINHKLTSIAKGIHRSIATVEIPTQEWFL